MANSTFQSITGPSGPEGIKAIGVTGNSGDTGGIGATGSEAPFVSQYRWSEVDPSNGEERIKLALSDESVVYVGGVYGQNAYVAGVNALGGSVFAKKGHLIILEKENKILAEMNIDTDEVVLIILPEVHSDALTKIIEYCQMDLLYSGSDIAQLHEVIWNEGFNKEKVCNVYLLACA